MVTLFDLMAFLIPVLGIAVGAGLGSDTDEETIQHHGQLRAAARAEYNSAR